MGHYEHSYRTCKKVFSKTLTPTEYEEGAVIYPHCGSEDVERRVPSFLPHFIEKARVKETTVGIPQVSF